MMNCPQFAQNKNMRRKGEAQNGKGIAVHSTCGSQSSSAVNKFGL